jgi:2-amino-4-hydroxy-6-hydroxymethyldihydropteridine diphosphokinase
VTDCAVGLGANLGDAHATLVEASTQIAALPATRLRGRSSIYRSAPVGPPGQPDYLNAAVTIDTALAPLDLLAELQGIEDRAGRQRSERWGARTLDLDLLIIEGVAMESPRLTLPHPRIRERNFVLRPLIDLLGASYEFEGRSLAAWLAQAPANRLHATRLSLSAGRSVPA